MNGVDAGLDYRWICSTAHSQKRIMLLLLLGQESGLH